MTIKNNINNSINTNWLMLIIMKMMSKLRNKLGFRMMSQDEIQLILWNKSQFYRMKFVFLLF